MNRSTKAWRRLSPLEKKAIAAHLQAVASLPCAVTGRTGVTLHHCHGGSMSQNGIHRGVSQRPSDWLVIPIVLELHVGPEGIDGSKGVESWEREHGPQFEHLKKLSQRLGYNVFELAGHNVHVEGLSA